MESEANIEDPYMVSKKNGHQIDLIVSPLPEQPVRSSEEKYIV